MIKKLEGIFPLIVANFKDSGSAYPHYLFFLKHT